jgi:DNA-binding NtrC family response regulator
VFLDEVGELPAALQAKLLRALEEGQVRRVGGLRPIPIDVRFVAATNRDLEAEVARGAFRSDLYFRLAGVVFGIPPLRDRPSEILPLARAFLRDLAARRGRPPLVLTEAAATLVQRYSWPGNIRELRNAMERAVLLSDGSVVDEDHLPLEKMGAGWPMRATEPPRPASAAPDPPRADDLRAQLVEEEKRRVLAALEACGGNQTQAARRLGIARGTLIARLEAFGVPRPRKG